MNIFLVILILLTVVSLLLKRKVLIMATCFIMLFAVFIRDFSISARVRNQVFLTEAQIEDPMESLGFSEGAFAVATYTRETRFYLHIYLFLILLLQIGSLYGKRPRKTLSKNKDESSD